MAELSGRKTAIALLLIVAIAFGLRFWGIGWGLPYVFHGDEPGYLPRAVKMLQGDLNPHFFWNPPGLMYLQLLEMLPFVLAAKLLGTIHSAVDVGRELYYSPTPFYLLARMNGVVLGSATVLVTYLVGRRLIGVNGGLLSALLMAVAFLHVRDSHYAVNDVPATFVLMVSFFFAVRIQMAGRLPAWGWAGNAGKPATGAKGSPAGLRDYLLGGAFLGLGVAMKYNVGLGAAALVAAHLTSRPGLWRTLNPRAHLPLVAAGAASLLAFILACPYSVLDFTTFLSSFLWQYNWASDPYRQSDVPVVQLILRGLTTGTSPLVVGAAVLGLAMMLLRRPRTALLLASFPLAYMAFFLFGTSFFPARFAIPLLPFVAIAAAHATQVLLGAIRPGRARAMAAVLAVALLATPPLAASVRHNVLVGVDDTRVLLGHWMDTNVPAGSKIALEGYTYIDTEGRSLGSGRYPYQREVLSSLRHKPLEYYVQEKFNYLLVSSYVYARYNLAPERHQQAIEWYQRLDQELPLVASFHPTRDGKELPFIMDEEITPIYTLFERVRPGPTLKVYRIGPPPEPALYRVQWAEPPIPAKMSPGQRLTIQVTARNTGNQVWPAGGFTPVRVGHRWLDSTGRLVDETQERSLLPEDVKPDTEFTVQVELVAPAEPGPYTVQLELIQENFAWLSTQGAEIKAVTVDVVSP